MKTFISLFLAAFMLVFTPMKAEAINNILDYNEKTNLRARIADGSVWPQVKKQYLSIGGYFYELGYNASERVLKTKYVPTYDCAVKFDEAFCKKPYKPWGVK